MPIRRCLLAVILLTCLPAAAMAQSSHDTTWVEPLFTECDGNDGAPALSVLLTQGFGGGTNDQGLDKGP
jgi:hypothetical protein